MVQNIPANPRLNYNEFDLGKLITDQPARLRDYLAAFFDILVVDAAGQTLSIKLEADYSYQLSPEVGSMNRIRLPILFLEPVDFVPEGATPLFVDSVADAVANWIRKSKPALNSSSRLNFQLDIFAGQTTVPEKKKPLLTVRNLYVDANAVEFPELWVV